MLSEHKPTTHALEGGIPSLLRHGGNRLAAGDERHLAL